MSGVGLGSQPNLGVGQLNQEAPVKNEGQVGGDKGIISKGIGVLKKMWLHISGKASNVHSQQLSSLKEHVSNKFGEDGLAKLNERFDKKGWNSDKSAKLFSGSEIKSELNRVERQVIFDQRVSDAVSQLKDMPISEQLKYPDMAKGLIHLATQNYDQEGLVSLTVLNGISPDANEVSDRQILEFSDRFLDGTSMECLNDNVMEGHAVIEGLENKNTTGLREKINNWTQMPEGPEKQEEKQQILDILHGPLKSGVENDVGFDTFRKIGAESLDTLYNIVGKQIVELEIINERLASMNLPLVGQN